MSLPRFRAVVFDLDGLVLDSEATYFAAWRQAAAMMGCHFDEAFCAGLSGLHDGAVSERLRAYCGADFDLGEFGHLSRDAWHRHVQQHGIAVKSGFSRLLAVIQQLALPFCLATNSRGSDAEFCLAAAGLSGIFSIMVSRDDVDVGKPAPDIFLKAASALGLAASECLVLEDSPVGVAAAYAAGSPCIYVPSIRPVDPAAVAKAHGLADDLGLIADLISAEFIHPL